MLRRFLWGLAHELKPSPSFFGGFRLLFCFVVLAMIVQAIQHAARSQPATPSAEWYANHPGTRERVVAACRDNPGAAARNDHCAAASLGNLIEAERLASRQVGPSPFDATPPSSPRFWAERPALRREHLGKCERADPSWRARNNCRAAGYT